jgi:two-component sensor histidine kinase
LRLPIRAAIALALVINELVTNAAKHSLTSSTKDSSSHDATIQVCLQQKQDNVSLSVQDNGPGFPSGFDPVRHAHIGLELVQTLVSNDLQGTLSFHKGTAQDGIAAGLEERGARVEITFPASLPD